MIYLKRLVLVVSVFMSTTIYADEINKINVFVSILPQQYFVQQVGTDYVDVHVMVGPGQNPATYEPTPQQMAALANADIYFSIGVPFEKAWLDKIKDNNSKLVVIECCESISNFDSHSDHDEHIDPHVWTSPKKVIQIVKLIEKSLVEIDIKKGSDYRASASSFVRELSDLDSVIKSKIMNLKNRIFIASHPSWSYFANEYDLTQVSIEKEGKEIQAKSMVKLIKLAKDKNIKAVFVQSQFNNKAAKIIAKEIGATVFELNPLAFNYIENMNIVADQIAEGLSYE